MKLSVEKKILLFGIILIIIAGIFVVALKGVNVSLQLQQHESIVVKVGKELELKDVKEICNNVFNNKEYVLKKVDLFNDSIDIIIESITDEEKQELINKLNEKYETELTTDDLTVTTNSNIRIRDIVNPYIKPILISVVVIGIVYAVIYRKKEIIIKYGKTLVIILVTEAFVASVIAITRIPVSQSIITLMLFVAFIEMIACMNKNK